MFGLTTTRRLTREALILHADIARLRGERDSAREERDAFKSAAKTAARQVADASIARPRPADDQDTDPVVAPSPRTPSAELLQALAHARALEERLAELQAVNMRCTCGGGVTPHTPRICECGHGHIAHTVPAPHSCVAFGQTCQCPRFRQLPHDQAVAQLERNRTAAAERDEKNGATA